MPRLFVSSLRLAFVAALSALAVRAQPAATPPPLEAPDVKVSGQASLESQTDQGVSIALDEPSGRAVVTFSYPDGQPLNIASSRDLAVRIENGASGELEILVTGLSDLKDTYKYSAVSRFFVRPAEQTDLHVFMPRQALPKDHPFNKRLGPLYAFPSGHQKFWTHVDAGAIIRVSVRLDWLDAKPGQKVVIGAPFGHGVFDVSPAALDALSLPLMDEFGQDRSRTWACKVASKDELHADAARDAALVAAVTRPGEGRTRFGGDTRSPRREATGFFRVEKIDGKWWFVDPEGALFWSLGVNGPGGSSSTTVQGREELFPEVARGGEEYNFYTANLKEKHGEQDWRKTHVDVTLARMLDWGLNTIGAWAPPDVIAARRVPYTLITHVGYQKIGSIHKIGDPFSDEFKNLLDGNLAKLAAEHAQSPWLLGVFIDNELEWKTGTALVEETLRSAKGVPARRALVEFLKARHGDLAGINRAWGSDFASTDDLRPLPNGNAAYKQDTADFLAHFSDAYFSACAAAMKKHFPNHLYLGCRFHVTNPVVIAAASRHCDVLSFNLYRYTVADFTAPTAQDRPYIIGEFHFGVRDLGAWGVGLCWAADSRNRADLVEAYLSDALRHPNIVGAHWFQWADQPVTGRRSDGENFGVGLVTIADRPAEALVGAFKTVSDALYEYRLASPRKRIGAP